MGKENVLDQFKIFFEGTASKELEQLPEISHAELLSEAFKALFNELDSHGNTDKFQELRKKYSLRLLKFWQNKIKIYQKAQKQNLVKRGEFYSLGDEAISVSTCGVYEDEDLVVLDIKRHTKTGNDNFQVTINNETGIDDFLSPPTIKSEVRLDPMEAPDIYYKVVFREGQINTFERTLYHTDPTHKLPFIKDTRSISY